jgi:dTDP-4-amino-4,6-dideoxygalactose transaminase
MTDIAASLGIHQLRRLDRFIEIRRRYARIYDEAFRDLDMVRTPIIHADRNHVYHLYAIQLELAQLTIDRAIFIEKLKELNIGASVHFIPLHRQPFYRDQFDYKVGDLPQADGLYESVLSLPLYPRMSEADVSDVIEAVYQIASTHRR